MKCTLVYKKKLAKELTLIILRFLCQSATHNSCFDNKEKDS